MKRVALSIVVLLVLVAAAVSLWRNRTPHDKTSVATSTSAGTEGSSLPDDTSQSISALSRGADDRNELLHRPDHPLLGQRDYVLLGDTTNDVLPVETRELIQSGTVDVPPAGTESAVIVDYPLDDSVFPPGMVPPRFLWHDDSETADTWLIEIKTPSDSPPIRLLAAGHASQPGAIDSRCISKHNEIYQPTAYQASAHSWTPSESLWKTIQQASNETSIVIRITGCSSRKPSDIVSTGTVQLMTSQDPVDAPILYRDVPLSPAVTEKNVIKPLDERAVSLIAWRLRDIRHDGSRLLLTDVPTCTNCHSFSADGHTIGMDLDGPQGDKGAYVLTSTAPVTRFESDDVISWNSFPDKPENSKTIGFLSRVSPDGQYVVSTLNESVFVANFLDYRFLQVFFPTRGILGVYSRASGEICILPGADDPQFVHCDAVWTPDGQTLVFARAKAKNPYTRDSLLPKHANDPSETQIQYDLYRIPFNDGHGGEAVPIAGASNNGMSNTFPKVSPDGKWIVFVKCKNGQLMRPDSTLWIVPLAGGEPRRMRCNTRLMNSWHSFSPNGRWLVFSSKANTPYTQMFLAHIDEDGNDSPPILIPNSTAANRAVNLPEFINVDFDELLRIETPALEYYRHAVKGARLAKEGKLNEALTQLEMAVQLQPDFKHAHVEAAIILAKQGRTDEALSRLNKALELDPTHCRAHAYAGIVLAGSGQLDKAIVRFQQALELDEYNRTSHLNLGRIYAEQGKPALAEKHLCIAVQLDDTDPHAHFELARLLLEEDESSRAVKELLRTISLDPRATEACLLLSKVYSSQGDYRSAVDVLEEALSSDGNNIRLVADLAWMLVAAPDKSVRNGHRAIELAERACVNTRNSNPVLLNTLAAAHAEVGDFSNAVRIAQQALQLAENGDQRQAEWIRSNLKGFRQGRPCRVAH